MAKRSLAPLLLEPSDAARRVGVTAPTLKKWAAERKIRIVARTPRGLRLFDPRDVDRLTRQRLGAERNDVA